MPYITCKDGHTYSRYDISPYVKQCIKDEDQYYRQLEINCNKNPDCVKSRQQTQSCLLFLFTISLITIFFLLYRMIKYLK